MTLEASEFIRRFLLHVIPSGFPRIRYYGLYANRNRHKNLAQCRVLLGETCPGLLPAGEALGQILATIIEMAAKCPSCQTGVMLREMKLPPIRWPERPP